MSAPTTPEATAAPVVTGLNGSSSRLARVLRAGKFAVCVEVSPPVGPNPEAIQREMTTLKGYGDAYNVTVALRKAIEEGRAVGPRIYTAGKSLATTGGHADPTNGYRSDLAGDPGPEEGVINGVEDARKAVRQRYKDGADFIKITATGGVLSLAKSGENPQFTDEELEAVVRIATDYGMHVAAHSHGSEGMKRAVLAGVRSIEHGTFMTDDFRRTIRGGQVRRNRILSRRREAQGRPGRAADSGHVCTGLPGRGEDRVRHRLRRVTAWQQCARVRLHGRGRDAGDGGHPGRYGDHCRIAGGAG